MQISRLNKRDGGIGVEAHLVHSQMKIVKKLIQRTRNDATVVRLCARSVFRACRQTSKLQNAASHMKAFGDREI